MRRILASAAVVAFVVATGAVAVGAANSVSTVPAPAFVTTIQTAPAANAATTCSPTAGGAHPWSRCGQSARCCDAHNAACVRSVTPIRAKMFVR
jgi:hypothetical protein